MPRVVFSCAREVGKGKEYSSSFTTYPRSVSLRTSVSSDELYSKHALSRRSREGAPCAATIASGERDGASHYEEARSFSLRGFLRRLAQDWLERAHRASHEGKAGALQHDTNATKTSTGVAVVIQNAEQRRGNKGAPQDPQRPTCRVHPPPNPLRPEWPCLRLPRK